MDSHDLHVFHILQEIEAEPERSQRSLASSVGIALGLTNLLIRRLVREGCVRAIRMRPNRVAYFLTPGGMAEKARMSRTFLQHSVRHYTDARDRVQDSLGEIAGSWSLDEGLTEKRVVFYGTGAVAEIAHVCLPQTDLNLVAVLGESDADRFFFGMPVHSDDDVRGLTVGGVPFERIIVTSFDERGTIRDRLMALGLGPERVHWL